MNWMDIFYLDEQPKLEFYSKVFNTVEVDSTFYELPIKRVVESWGWRTSQNFSFSFKISRTLTHRRKFKVDSNFQEELKFS